MVFAYASATEVMLPIEASVRAQADRQSRQLSRPQGRWNAYLNSMCSRTVLFWLQADYALSAQIWLAQELPALWGAVNGTALEMDGKRFVLIPDKQIYCQELIVPQEWIDLPDWAGDYFLAAQVDPEGEWLRLWGYTTHAHIKTVGDYQASDRTYTLGATQLVRDITALWVVRQLNPDEPTQAALSPIPSLAPAQLQAPMQTIAAAERVPPQLAISFSQWGAMLSQGELRRQLYPHWFVEQPPLAVNLMNWLQQRFEQGWDSLESLLTNQPQLAYSLRYGSDPATAVIRRVRSISLGAAGAATLMVMLEPDGERSPKIRVRLYPGDRPLPTNLSLALLTEVGEVAQWVQAGEAADFIQLKRFTCPTGQSFWIQVALDEPVFLEAFVG